MSSFLLLAVAIFLVAFEFQNLLSWRGGRTIKPGRERSQDFTIVVPVFGHPRYFDGERLLRYRHRVLVAMEIGAPSMAEFANQLEAEGWKVARLVLPDPNPATLLAAALPVVSTTYTFRLDADTVVGDEVPAAVAAADSAGADFDRNLLHLPVLTSYYLIAIWASWYFKCWTMLSPAAIVSSLPLVYIAKLFVTVSSNLQVVSPWMIVFPFYSLAQVLVMPVFGALTYFELARSRRCGGRYRFGYRRREALRVIRRVVAYPTGRS